MLRFTGDASSATRRGMIGGAGDSAMKPSACSCAARRRSTCSRKRSSPAQDDATNARRADGSRSSAASKTLFNRRRSEEHTSELQSRFDLVCRLLLEKKKQ